MTAYDRYAVRAFDVNALDYLLKPVHPDRLAETIARLEGGATSDEPEQPRRLAATDRLFLRIGGRRRFVAVADIVAIRADGEASIVHFADGTAGATRKSLRAWEQRLPEPQFLRVHRGAIANLDRVRRVEEWSHSSSRLYLEGLDEPVTMSRRYGARVRRMLG